jgi:7-carboxy-7-deazaguanine synthase
VEVTGGEPLIQAQTPDLVRQLLDSGFTVLLETNGSQDISGVDPRCIKIVDFKCPSSGETDANDYQNMERMQDHDEVKCVIGNREDYNFAREILLRLHHEICRRNTVLFSPIYGRLDAAELAQWILEDCLHVRLNIQQHKYIWSPHLKGV